MEGWALENLGRERADEAAEAYRRALEIEPQSIAWRAGLANSLFGAGRPEEAKQEYQEVLKKCEGSPPGDLDSLAALGWCHYRLGNYDDALRLFADCLSINPGMIYVRLDFALALLCSGRTLQALREYDQIIKVDLAKQSPLRRRGLLKVAFDDLETALGSAPELQKKQESDEVKQLVTDAATGVEQLLRESRSLELLVQQVT